MSQETMEDSINTDQIQQDPLLQPGAYIDPNPPSSNGNATPKTKLDVVTSPQPSDQKPGPSPPMDITDPNNRPEWLPSHWSFKETVRTSGASAGSKDKYFIEPGTNRRFRSKKEVFNYLETGITPKMQKRKNADSEADNTPQPSIEAPPKRKKIEAKAKVSMKNFNFDDVPEKVKWVMTDVFEGTWRPLINSVDRVPESSKQEWAAAYTYLTMQNGGRTTS